MSVCYRVSPVFVRVYHPGCYTDNPVPVARCTEGRKNLRWLHRRPLAAAFSRGQPSKPGPRDRIMLSSFSISAEFKKRNGRLSGLLFNVRLPFSIALMDRKRRMMISTKTEEVLEQAVIRVAAAGNGKDEVLVHLVSDERCFSALAMPAASPRPQDVTSDCVDLLAQQQEILAKPNNNILNQNQGQNHHIGGLRPNFSLPSVVIHSASSNNGSGVSSPKANKKKKKKSKGEEVGSSTMAARSQSFKVRSPRTIPLLKLPDDYDDDDNDLALNIPPPIHVEAATSDEGESVDVDETKNIPRKRRKSLVNLLFSSSSSSTKNESSTCPNTLDTGGGQRLHFRRLSEIICRLGGSKDDDKQATLNTQTSKDDSDLGNMDSPSGTGGGGGSAGLTLRQLFPYRRRRSSVSHLDNTDQFRETKEEYLISARRRMSSFPPSDGDESAIVLEKIHSMGKIEIGMPSTPTECCGTPTSHSSPFKLLRRGPGGLFPSSKSKKSKWKSSTDIPASLLSNSSNGPGSGPPGPPVLTVGVSNSSNTSSNLPQGGDTPPPVVVVAAAVSSSSGGKSSKDSNSGSSSNKKSGSGQTSSFLRPGFPLMSRRGSSPLESELNALRKTISEGPGSEPPRNVVVFPRRRLEDVPGIFIPGRSKGDSVSNLLGVRISKDDDRRRHSISDPILLQQQLSSMKQLPSIRPRSPYLADQRFR